MELIDLPNLGSKTVSLLERVGINSIETLENLGARDAWVKLREVDDVCINVLYALEGAIQRINDKDLSENDKNKLKEFYRDYNDKNR